LTRDLQLQTTLLITGTALVALATGLFFAGVHQTIWSPIKAELRGNRPTGSNPLPPGGTSGAPNGASNGQPTAAISDDGQFGDRTVSLRLDHVKETGEVISPDLRREVMSGPNGHAIHVTASSGNVPPIRRPTSPPSHISDPVSAGEISDPPQPLEAHISRETAAVSVAPDGTYTVQGHFFSITGLLNDPNAALQDKP